MTRINLVPPEELCDQHLLAEHRELTRIPNAVAKGKYHLKGQPAEYKLGEGHVRFFFNKLAFLKKRYDALHAECKARGFNVQYIWNETLPDDPSLWLDYEATEAALQINRERIQERMPLKARFTGSIVIENVFGIPGVGQLFVNGALNRDYGMILGLTILVGIMTILFNAILDILYAIIDPKIRY